MFYLDPQTLKRYTLGTPFTYNGIQYTAAGASHTTFTSLGFTQVLVGPRPDGRFYVVSGPDHNGDYSKTPRNLDDLKTEFIKQEKQNSFQLLASTDWYILRFIDLGFTDPHGAIPTAIKTYRQNVRNSNEQRCQEIYNCQTVEELETLINGDTMTPWPTLDTDTYAVYS